MEYPIDGVADKFAFRRKMPDADLLAKAYAFLGYIPDYKAAFISYGMAALFDTELQEAAEAFELSMNTVDGAVAEHIAGTANVAAKVRQGMTIFRILDGIAKNVYNRNRGKYAAWAAASHIERDPKPKTLPMPTPA